jgi:uncharacterized protein
MKKSDVTHWMGFKGRIFLGALAVAAGALGYELFQYVKGHEALHLIGLGDAPKILWRDLEKFDPYIEEIPDRLKQLSGKIVRIPGYMVPLEDDQTQVSEFLLVPYAGACIHVPPPPANQMVWVKMAGGRPLAFTWDPIWIEGEFMITESNSPYGKVAFQMKGLKFKLYQE